MADGILIGIAILKVGDLFVKFVLGPGPARVPSRHESGTAGQLHARLENEADVLVGLLVRCSAIHQEQRDVARTRWHQISDIGGQRADDDSHLHAARVGQRDRKSIDTAQYHR
jgi:hypothetical protein